MSREKNEQLHIAKMHMASRDWENKDNKIWKQSGISDSTNTIQDQQQWFSPGIKLANGPIRRD